MFHDIEKVLFGKTADQLSASEKRVLKLARERKTLSSNASDDFFADSTTGQRLADAIARIGGSWAFIISFLTFVNIPRQSRGIFTNQDLQILGQSVADHQVKRVAHFGHGLPFEQNT